MFSSANKKLCSNCNTLSLTESMFIEFNENSQYLVLLNPVFSIDSKFTRTTRLKNKITIENPNNILINSINGKKISFKLKSFITHHGTKFIDKNSHFVAWIKRSKKNILFRISDEDIKQYKKLINLDSAFMIFLKINRQKNHNEEIIMKNEES